MENVGNIDEARLIMEWYYSHTDDESYGDFHVPPTGWTKLGSGCYRTAFKAPSGAVYKLERYPDPYQSNRGEDENLRRLYWDCKFPKGSRLPRWTLYKLATGNVMAMEYLPLSVSKASYQDHGDPWPLIRKMQDVSGITDMHGGNVAVDETTKEIVPIDLGGRLYS